MNTSEVLYPATAAVIAAIIAIIDLLQTFSGKALQRAIGWTLVYAIAGALVGTAFFFLLLNVNVSLGPVSASPIIKAILSGLLFKPLIQSKLFMMKIEELDEPNYGPAATYEKLTNVIKKQISMASVASNIELFTSYMTAPISDLKNKTVSLIYAHEMWTDEEKRRQVETLETELAVFATEDAKKIRLAQYLHQNGGANLDRIDRFHKKIGNLSEAQLREVGERVLKNISDPTAKEYFRNQLFEPNTRIQTLRKLIIKFCNDGKIIEDVLANRLGV